MEGGSVAELGTEELKRLFAEDHFASDACGCRIEEARPGYARASFEIERHHRNQRNEVMGGAIFTLGDFAIAVASHATGTAHVAVSCSIDFLTTVKGTRLIAEARAERDGRHLAFYSARITDELGTYVARMSSTGFAVGEIPEDVLARISGTTDTKER